MVPACAFSAKAFDVRSSSYLHRCSTAVLYDPISPKGPKGPRTPISDFRAEVL